LLDRLAAGQSHGAADDGKTPEPAISGQGGSAAAVGRVSGPGGSEDRAAAEAVVPLEWKPGDVILDLYKVLPLVEGFGEDVEEKPYLEGGFGRVYRVRHLQWEMDLALKCPQTKAFKTPEDQENFIRECESWIGLGMHPSGGPDSLHDWGSF